MYPQVRGREGSCDEVHRVDGGRGGPASGRRGQAGATTIFYEPAKTHVRDGPISAQAEFILGQGTVTVVLTNFENNQRSLGQSISGIEFDVSGARGFGHLKTVNTGQLISIQKGGAYSPAGSDLKSWKASIFFDDIQLTTLGWRGEPNGLIIGSPDGHNLYSDADRSIWKKHNRSVFETATFTITVPWVTPNSRISEVEFEFGTCPTEVRGKRFSPTPEPATLTLAGLNTLGLLGYGWWRRRKQTA
jgi:hypothetical protein